MSLDVEIHKTDTGIYALDFGRLLPTNNKYFPYS